MSGKARQAAPRGKVRERVLDTAEHLFASKGVSAVTLRSIAAAATVNVAAVNYYFGTKERLFEEMFLRRMVPLNEQRLAMLESCPPTCDSGERLQCIVRAFVSPALSLLDDATPSARAVVVQYLLGRILAMPEVDEKLVQYYDLLRQRFVAALHQALPHISEQDLIWRYYWMGGCVMTSLAIGSASGAYGAQASGEQAAYSLAPNDLERFLVQAFSHSGAT